MHALLISLLPASLLPLLPLPDSEGGAVDRTALLESLTSGQLLCVAYNTGVRKSRRPWGYISKDAIHDVAALEAQFQSTGNGEEADAKAKKGWTFRRTDNLRLWAAYVVLRLRSSVLMIDFAPLTFSFLFRECRALKIRYMLPIVTPSQPGAAGTPSGTPLASPAATVSKFQRNATEPPIVFDARLVARKEADWESVLEALLLRWVSAVVEERRAGQ